MNSSKIGPASPGVSTQAYGAQSLPEPRTRALQKPPLARNSSQAHPEVGNAASVSARCQPLNQGTMGPHPPPLFFSFALVRLR